MVVLVSRSPRRIEILTRAGIPFIVRPADVDETPHPDENPLSYSLRVAEDKALAVEAAPEEIVLGADTIVAIGNEILGKPAVDTDDARMLRRISGRRHDVITGLCIRFGDRIIRDSARTSVWFAELSPQEITEYVASGEPSDKAGAYAIQGLASKFVERIDGCYSNVVGLPIALVYRYLRDLAGPAAVHL